MGEEARGAGDAATVLYRGETFLAYTDAGAFSDLLLSRCPRLPRTKATPGGDQSPKHLRLALSPSYSEPTRNKRTGKLCTVAEGEAWFVFSSAATLNASQRFTLGAGVQRGLKITSTDKRALQSSFERRRRGSAQTHMESVGQLHVGGGQEGTAAAPATPAASSTAPPPSSVPAGRPSPSP